MFIFVEIQFLALCDMDFRLFIDRTIFVPFFLPEK